MFLNLHNMHNNKSCALYALKLFFPFSKHDDQVDNMIYLNSRNIEICKACVEIDDYTVVEHGYVPSPLNDSHIYYIQLKENITHSQQMKISIW